MFSGVERKDPFQKDSCKYGDKECIVRGNCSEVNVCYEIACTMCEEVIEEEEIRRPGINTQARWVGGRRRVNSKVYIGNTGKSCHSRQAEHMGGLRREDKGNALFKHTQETHSVGESPKFVMRVLSKHRTNIQRLITEGISIEKVRKSNPNSLLNSKAEWGRAKLVRHSATSQIF